MTTQVWSLTQYFLPARQATILWVFPFVLWETSRNIILQIQPSSNPAFSYPNLGSFVFQLIICLFDLSDNESTLVSFNVMGMLGTEPKASEMISTSPSNDLQPLLACLFGFVGVIVVVCYVVFLKWVWSRFLFCSLKWPKTKDLPQCCPLLCWGNRHVLPNSAYSIFKQGWFCLAGDILKHFS